MIAISAANSSDEAKETPKSSTSVAVGLVAANKNKKQKVIQDKENRKGGVAKVKRTISLLKRFLCVKLLVFVEHPRVIFCLPAEFPELLPMVDIEFFFYHNLPPYNYPTGSLMQIT